jgi:hypothetical protein
MSTKTVFLDVLGVTTHALIRDNNNPQTLRHNPSIQKKKQIGSVKWLAKW